MRARTFAAFMMALRVAAGGSGDRGSIEGVVKDSSGAMLPGATVEVKGQSAGGEPIDDGRPGVYRFPSLSPGPTRSPPLFRASTPPRARPSTSLGQVLKVDLAMQVRGLTESVQVTAESPLIDVKKSAAFQNIHADFIDRLPKGRDFTSS